MGQTIFGSNNLKKWKQIYNKQDFRNLLKGIAKWCRQSNWFPGAMGCCFFQFFHLTPIVHDNKLNFFTLNQANVQWYMTTTNSVFQQENCSIIFLKLTLYPPHLSPAFPQFQTWVLWNMTKFIHYWIFSWSEIEALKINKINMLHILTFPILLISQKLRVYFEMAYSGMLC